MTGESDRQRSDEYEQAFLAFRRMVNDVESMDMDLGDLNFPQDVKQDLNDAAYDLLEAAVDEDPATQSEAIDAVGDHTQMNKNDARAHLNTERAQATLDAITFESITKLVPHDPERDPVYVVALTYEGETRLVRCDPSEILNPGPFAERLFVEFDVPETLPKKDEWREFIGDAFDRMKVDVDTEDPTRPEHVVAESVVSRLSSCDVTVNGEEFRTNTGTTIYYDESAEQALVAADLVDTARGRINESASGDAVVSVLQERGLVPDEDNVVRPWGEGYFRVWEFTPSALIEQGVVEARLFEEPSDGRGGEVVA